MCLHLHEEFGLILTPVTPHLLASDIPHLPCADRAARRNCCRPSCGGMPPVRSRCRGLGPWRASCGAGRLREGLLRSGAKREPPSSSGARSSTFRARNSARARALCSDRRNSTLEQQTRLANALPPPCRPAARSSACKSPSFATRAVPRAEAGQRLPAMLSRRCWATTTTRRLTGLEKRAKRTKTRRRCLRGSPRRRSRPPHPPRPSRSTSAVTSR